MKLRLLYAVSAGLLVLGMGAGPAQAQGGLAELRGTVVDESGAAVPGATVTATNVDTGMKRSTQTSATGSYAMPSLPLGTYELRAELTGFSRVVQQGLRLGVGDTVNLKLTMKVAVLEETVTVTAQSVLIETTTSNLSGRVEQTQVQNLPLNGRNWIDLVALVPGARGNPGNVSAGAAGGDAANYQMDGLQVNGQGTGVETQNYSQEAIREFEVLTNRFDAEYGRALGAVVNAVSKSGTNAFHGGGFLYLRNDKWDATNPLYLTNGKADTPPTDIKQMGASLGGPIARDKAHFFATYERQMQVLTAQPATGYSQFDVPIDQGTTLDFFTGRVDYQPNADHRLFARASVHEWLYENVFVGGTTTLTAGGRWPATIMDFMAGDTWVTSPRTVHEFRIGRWSEDKKIDETAAGPQYSFPSAILNGPFANVPQWWKEDTWQFKYTLSYFLAGKGGDHRFKFGANYIRANYEGELPERAYGQFFFDRDPADFNSPATYPNPTSFSTQLGEFYYQMTNPIYSLFLQDDWSVTSKLTLNLGVRWDAEPDVLKDSPNPLDGAERKADWDNVAPRLGFAFDVFGNRRTVVRGGAGIYYGNLLLDIVQQEARTQGKITVTVPNPTSLTDPLGGLTYDDFIQRGIARDLWVVSNDYKAPRNDQISFGFAQQFGSKYMIQADYVRVRSKHLPLRLRNNYFEDPVTHLPKDPRVFGVPYPQWRVINFQNSEGRAEYDGLQVGFLGRRGDGRFEFQGTYTLSSTKGHADPNRYGFINNPFNLDDDYGPLLRDQRHRFVFNGTVFLPLDFQVSTIFYAGSPYPLNIGTSLDPFRLGYSGRWLDATGQTVPKNGERGTRSDYKLDLRIQKNVKVGGVKAQAIVDVFNILNRSNYGAYGTNYFRSNYLQPVYSTASFYQPRQVQLGVRVDF